MKRPAALLAVVLIWLLALTCVNAVVLTFVIKSTNGVHTLLLDGHTASAKSAKKTATEVQGQSTQLAYQSSVLGYLKAQQDFDHQSTVNGEKALKRTIRRVERHLDSTIRRAVNNAAHRFAATLHH